MQKPTVSAPLITALALLLAGLACNAPLESASDSPSESAGGESTAVAPALTPTDTQALAASDTPASTATTSGVLRGSVVYESDMRSGWVNLSTDTGALQQTVQGYSITVDSTAPWALWSFTTLVRRDSFFAEISASTTTCAPQGAFGLMFDYVNETSFSFFIIRCDGSYSLFQRQNSATATLLLTGPLPEGVSPNSGPLRVGVRRNAGLLELYINEGKVGEKENVASAPGDLGPYVQTGNGATTVVFTDLRVYEALP